MAYFAKIENGLVVNVICCEKEFINAIDGNWIETNPDGLIRKNYAAIGDFYDDKLDAFIPPKKFESWIFDSNLCRWVSPLPYPDDGLKYQWDDFSVSWKLIEDKE